MSTVIGFIIPLHSQITNSKTWHFVCNDCNNIHPEITHTPIYKENIFPYSQSCWQCNKEIVKGSTPAWPNLYD